MAKSSAELRGQFVRSPFSRGSYEISTRGGMSRTLTPRKVMAGNRFFVSPEPAGRRITAGFSFVQRIGKSANVDVWFPKELREALSAHVSVGKKLSPQEFPAEWAAVRQFELLQEAGNYKIYDLDAGYLTRSMVDMSRNMRAGGYRVTVASVGSYEIKNGATKGDDLEILDQRLQSRISALTHMLYLEEESEKICTEQNNKLREGNWSFRNELPHIGLTLGARNLFKPRNSDLIHSAFENRHRLAEHFFDILDILPQSHIVHDTAIGLQLPDANAENEWIYCAEGENTLRAFNILLTDIFAPFDKTVRFSSLHGYEAGMAPELYTHETKATVQHMRGYGDRLTSSADQFYSHLAHLTLQ